MQFLNNDFGFRKFPDFKFKYKSVLKNINNCNNCIVCPRRLPKSSYLVECTKKKNNDGTKTRFHFT